MNYILLGLAIFIVILILVLIMTLIGILPRRSVGALRASEFPNVNPRYYEKWQYHRREATRKSIWVSQLFILSLVSGPIGLKAVLYSFLLISIIVAFAFYRIWRVPNEYMKEIGLRKTDVKSAMKKSEYY